MSGTEELHIDREGVRLDAWLCTLASVGSRKKAKQLLLSGRVTLGRQACGPNDSGRKLEPGMKLFIHWNKPGSARRHTVAKQRLQALGISLPHIDSHMVVANKPAGMLTDTANREQAQHRDSLRKQLQEHFEQVLYPAHRIDRDTSGLVAFARDKESFDHLRAQWSSPEPPARHYLVAVQGQVEGDEGSFEDWMAWDSKDKHQRPCGPDDPGAVLAKAKWRVMGRRKHMTLVQVSLMTGRRNQIRLHAQLWGHPLVGERQYLPKGAPPPKSGTRQVLHASGLTIRHPVTNQKLTFSAPLPQDIAGLFSTKSKVQQPKKSGAKAGPKARAKAKAKKTKTKKTKTKQSKTKKTNAKR